MKKIRDLTGHKYGKLTVLSYFGIKIKSGSKYGHHCWNCQCECGKLTVVRGAMLRTKNRSTKTCGCHRFKGEFTAKISTIKNTYKHNAKLRNIEFHLTSEDIKSLIYQNCYYCGTSPSNTLKAPNKYHKDSNYNGIDRVDNNIPYIKTNCVPCCFSCNKWKGNLNVEFFLSHAQKIAAHQNKVNKDASANEVTNALRDDDDDILSMGNVK